MDEKNLLWFAAGFRTVAAWRDAMFAHGYSMPVQLCHGLSGAMKRLKLTFPEAFRLLWVKKKIGVSGRSLLYDFSASILWDAGPQPPGAPLTGPTQPTVAGHRDVLALVPPTEDIVRLESAWCLAADSSPLMKLALWHPTDEGDQWFRQFLLDFGHEVAAVQRQDYAALKELAFKAVNDDLGYAAGDETLRGMAEVLLRQTRGINVICRYGGNRFATLLVETSKGGARLYADRIRYVLSSYQFAHRRSLTASFGIASVPEDAAPTADELIRAADKALCAAKRAGKNRIGVLEDLSFGGQ